MTQRYIDKDMIGKPAKKSCYKTVSPLPEEDVSFNWLNMDFPYWHFHDHFEIYVITAGSFVHEINNSVHTLNVGDACLIRPKDLHKLSYNHNAASCHLAILFTKDYAKKIFNAYDPDFYNQIINSPSPLHFSAQNYPITKIIDTTLSLSKNNLSVKDKTIKTKMLINSMLSDFFEQNTITTKSFPQWFSEFLLVLNDPSLKMSMQDLAKHTSYSYSRLSRIFKEYMDMTIIEYVTNNKLRHACHLLSSTNLSILAISNELAYDSISYFNKNFKLHFNITPSQYRKNSVNPPNEFM